MGLYILNVAKAVPSFKSSKKLEGLRLRMPCYRLAKSLLLLLVKAGSGMVGIPRSLTLAKLGLKIGLNPIPVHWERRKTQDFLKRGVLASFERSRR